MVSLPPDFVYIIACFLHTKFEFRGGRIQRIVLVVDDNPADLCILRMAIYESGIPDVTVITDDGSTAMELCRLAGSTPEAAIPDIIFLDLNLGRHHSGFEILNAIRANSFLDSTSVVVVSGSERPADIQRCYELNANAYIFKPDDVDEVFKVICKTMAFWCRRGTDQQ